MSAQGKLHQVLHVRERLGDAGCMVRFVYGVAILDGHIDQTEEHRLVVLAKRDRALQRVSLKAELIMDINFAHILVVILDHSWASYLMLLVRVLLGHDSVERRVSTGTQEVALLAIQPCDGAHARYHV